ncbi:DJ-1/PfpI family protein [Nocardia paucivorans]|uniref:DJ-1/PfpI family protein n=1 Tax=Nocardia paucivorans TaxID=114259 RepID=UPI000593BB06|nr:DJ-1/PfpI family protein [Nocardia paucivorans]
MDRRRALQAIAAAGSAPLVAACAPSAGEDDTSPPVENARKERLRVHIVMYDGVEELDFIAPFEVFCAAGVLADGSVDVDFVTTGRTGLVRAAYGTEIQVTKPWAPHSADIVVVPGGGYTQRDEPGIWSEIDRGVLPRALADCPRNGLTITSVCTGAILLGAAGLVKGRPCTTHHRARATLEQQGGLVKNARVVDDGNLVTAGGITSGLELAIWLTRRELGADVVAGLEEMLEYEARGTVWAA